MKNRITALLLAVILALAVTASAAPGRTGADEPFAAYKNPAYNFQAQYPAKWKMAEGVMGTVVVFASPLESDDDKFMENVNVAIEDLAAYPGITSAKYEEAAIGILSKVITDFRLVDRRDHAIAGKPARIIEYTGRQGVFRLHFLQAFVLADGRAYVLTFTAEETNFSRYEPVALRIVDSFTIK